MSSFDKKLRKMAAEEEKSIPDSLHRSIEDVLNNLPPKSVEIKKKSINWATAAKILAAVTAAFVIMVPNVSRTAAGVLENLPVAGVVIKVITVRNYFYKDGNAQIHVKKPWIDMEDKPSQNIINKSVDELTQMVMDRFNSDVEKYGTQAHIYKCVDYSVVTDNDNWFSLKMIVTETAASTSVNTVFYNIDKKTWDFVRFDELFKENSDYETIIGEEITRQMKVQMEKDDSLCYWIKPGANCVELGADTAYYLRDDGGLTIVFQQGEVGPYSMGNPEFIISEEIINECLKDCYINR